MARPRWLRPLPLVALVFIAAGLYGIIRGLWSLAAGAPFLELGPMVLSGIVALAGGALVLAGARWGRWLLAVWMAFHIVLGFMHGPLQLGVHAVFFVAAAYVLFRPERQPEPERQKLA